MRGALLAFALLAAPVAAEPLSVDEARQVMRTKLAHSIGADAAAATLQVAFLTGFLAHCGREWAPWFDALVDRHRRYGRTDAELQRIAVWHGHWQVQARAAAERDAFPCDERALATVPSHALDAIRGIGGG